MATQFNRRWNQILKKGKAPAEPRSSTRLDTPAARQETRDSYSHSLCREIPHRNTSPPIRRSVTKNRA